MTWRGKGRNMHQAIPQPAAAFRRIAVRWQFPVERLYKKHETLAPCSSTCVFNGAH